MQAYLPVGITKKMAARRSHLKRLHVVCMDGALDCPAAFCGLLDSSPLTRQSHRCSLCAQVQLSPAGLRRLSLLQWPVCETVLLPRYWWLPRLYLLFVLLNHKTKKNARVYWKYTNTFSNFVYSFWSFFYFKCFLVTYFTFCEPTNYLLFLT